MGSGAGDELRVGAAARPILGLVSSVQVLVEAIDPGQVPARDAVDLVRVFDRLGRLADAGKALAAGAASSESDLWRHGHRSPAHWMAGVTGVGIGDAMALLDTAAAVADAPVTKEALVAGTVSPQQANAVAKVEKTSPGEGARLLDDARSGRRSLKELKDESTRIVHAASGETDAEKAERQRKARSLRTGVDGDGMGYGHWRLPPAQHGWVMAQLQAGKDHNLADARAEGGREPIEAYAADALVKMARPRPGPVVASDAAETGDEDWSFAKVIVRVDAAALERGELAPGEVCEIAGQGPIPVADTRRMIGHDAFVAAISTNGTEIHKVVHLGRKATALQRTALEWLSAGECSIEGCTSPARLEIDHVADWADTKVTRLGDLSGPCGHHHDLKTHHDYRFGPLLASGKRQLIPPDETGSDPPPAAGSDPPSVEPSPISDAPTARARTRDDTTPNQGDLFDTG